MAYNYITFWNILKHTVSYFVFYRSKLALYLQDPETNINDINDILTLNVMRIVYLKKYLYTYKIKA